jgi:hypothetical protein
MNKKILLCLAFSFILVGCQSSIKGNTTNSEKPKNIDFKAETLKDNYFSYVNTADLVNMPPISDDLKNYLLSQISENTTNVRETVELKEKFDDKMKDSACGSLPTNLCAYNAHLYSGSYFGLRLYEKANSQELLNNSIVAAPLTMWSIKWIKNSYANGLNIAKICKDGDNDCLNKNAKNPIEKLVAICQVKSPNNINECLGLMLNKTENKDFAFMVGYITGYNISFNVGNGMK